MDAQFNVREVLLYRTLRGEKAWDTYLSWLAERTAKGEPLFWRQAVERLKKYFPLQYWRLCGPNGACLAASSSLSHPRADLATAISRQVQASGLPVRFSSLQGSQLHGGSGQAPYVELIGVPLVEQRGPVGCLLLYMCSPLDLPAKAFGDFWQTVGFHLAPSVAAFSPKHDGPNATQTNSFHGMVYASDCMQGIVEQIRAVAPVNVPVMITGESGTGKECVAQAIHRASQRSKSPFLVQNVGALPDNLLESEWFGHTRGAFSGASTPRIGMLEAADGGTLFLDEIGEASEAMQVRLLRFLENGTFRRLGENKQRSSDVRIVAATNRDLWEAVQAGTFREDLYYRLNVYPIHIPPLRQRRQDIPLLAHYFVQRFNQAMGKNISDINPALLKTWQALHWRGNVRELKNVVQRTMVACQGVELDDDANIMEADQTPMAKAVTQPPRGYQQMERAYFEKLLDYTNGNKSKAAEIAGLKRGTFRSKLKRLGL